MRLSQKQSLQIVATARNLRGQIQSMKDRLHKEELGSSERKACIQSRDDYIEKLNGMLAIIEIIDEDHDLRRRIYAD